MKLGTFIDDRFIQYSLYCARTKSGNKFMILIRRFLSLLFRKKVATGELNGLIFFASTKRQDHLTFFETIYNTAETEKSRMKLLYKKRINLQFLFSYFLHLPIKKHIKHVRLYDETKQNGFFIHKTHFFERSWLYLDVLESLSFDSLFSKLSFDKCTGCVVLYDTCQPERNLVRAFNKHDKVSITLCHGIFNPHIDYMQESFLNYWQSDAKYALTWGCGTARLFDKYSSHTKSIICGNPIIGRLEPVLDSNYIGIVLSVGNLFNDNQRMIEIAQLFAKKHNFKIHIRIHPGDDYKRYTIDSKISCFDSFLDSDYLIVCHTSAMLYTYLAQGKRVFKYIGKTPTYNTDLNISFNSFDEIDKLFIRINEIDFASISRYEIESIGEESKKRYRLAFDGIVCKRSF